MKNFSELTRRIAMTAIVTLASGALRLVGKYPTGKGSNWVEIVSFDRS